MTRQPPSVEANMENDDAPIGRVLTRREVLALLGASGAALLVGCTSGAEGAPEREAERQARGRGAHLDCVVRPEQTAGPYFVDERLHRSDIRSEPTSGVAVEGVPLALAFAVSLVRDGRCTPAEGVTVDLWQCDALGVYSDVRDSRFDTTGQKFLRGYQVTDADGTARFLTIYPGWYPGRTVHLHFKVRTDPAAARGHDFTSQLYFDDGLTDRVHARPPYASRGERTTRNRDDGIFRRGGDELMLALAEEGEGYAGTLSLGLAVP